MPVGLAMVLWIVELGPTATSPATPSVLLSPADLAQTSSIMNRAPAHAAEPPLEPHPSPLRDSPAASAPDDFALLFGDPRDGGQVVLGALGGGRADAPGLIHVSLALDF